MGKLRKERKFTKRGYRAYLKKNAEAMRQMKKVKKNNETPQDPVVGSTDIQHFTMNNDSLECKVIKQEIDLEFESDEIEETLESGSDASCDTRSNEELWVVRRKLCRGCHSDGAFWSLQTTTEGDTYGDLLQTYFNIQLCPVSKDELALSAICALCAARLREVRAFSAQARTAEERFTRLYKQNRIRVIIDEELVKKEAPNIFNEVLVNKEDIKIEVPKIFNEVDDSQITDDVKPDTAHSKLEASIEELPQERSDKPASKKLSVHLTLADYERVGNLFKCPRCNKLYGKRYIRYHIKTQHSIIGKKESKNIYELSPSDFELVGNSYRCTRCEKQFKQYARVRYHVTYTHLKIPRYTCYLCDKTFHCLSPFTKHKLEEHSVDDRIKCNACDWFTYRTKSVLKRHKNDFHMLGEKRACPDCDYFCYSERSMKRHVIKHSTVKEHHCRFCKKSFLRKNNLNFHERIHTGDKRQVCNVCGQAFVQRASLKYHMEKHHPEVH